jgi:hypothetical protein
MKDWNITQLNFSNNEYKKLISSYWKILILAAQIDGDVNEKEIDTILSLIVRTPLKIEDRNFFRKINHIDIESENIINKYRIKNNYLQVFELENIIFFEIERNMIEFIKALTNKELIDRLTEEKIDDLKNQLKNIKEILESKKELIWEDYIQAFYEGLYDYVEKITKMVGKWFLINKIWKDEKLLLSTIKEELNIKWDIDSKAISLNRHNYILFD